MGRDLSGRSVAVLAFVLLGAIAWLDLTDGELGLAFSVGFVLIALTAPMAVRLSSVVSTGVLPPPLLILTLLGVAAVDPAGLPIAGLSDEAGVIARTIAATLDHGTTLVVGHVLALVALVLRNVWAAKARALSPLNA